MRSRDDGSSVRRSPYVAEIEAIAATLGYPGIWFLNGCYQWGCTALAREQAGAPWLARTLDWPFPGLGRHLEVARMQGPAGDFRQCGLAGLCRRADRDRRPADSPPPSIRRRSGAARGTPGCVPRLCAECDPHLAHPFHSAGPSAAQRVRDLRIFGEARHRLETTPIARPVIYSLVGCEAGERCIIERTEEDFRDRPTTPRPPTTGCKSAPPWEARTRADLMFTRSYEETAANSRARREHFADWRGTIFQRQRSTGSRRRFSIPIRGWRSRCARRKVSCARSDTRRFPVPNCRNAVTLTCDLQDAAA